MPADTDAAPRALIDPYDHASILFGMEHLAWGVFLGVGTIFGGLVLRGGRNGNAIRWLLVGTGILALLHVVGLVLPQDALYFLGYPAAGVLLPAATILMVRSFGYTEDGSRA